MDLGQIISNSFKYPFNDLKGLVIVCIMFALPLVFPIGIIYNSEPITVLGIIFILVFILIIPGYTVSIVKNGTRASNVIPSLKVGRNIVNTFKLLLLRIVYMIIPTLVFLILLFALGSSSMDSIFKLQFSGFISAIGTILIGSYVVYLVFIFLSIFAKVRLAYYDSLLEALKINKVIKDIKKIGVGRAIGWYIVMAILMGFISFVCVLLFFIPYVGFAIYVCIALPIMLIIYYYSLGLLFSNIAEANIGDDSDLDLDQFEKEIQRLKYLN